MGDNRPQNRRPNVQSKSRSKSRSTFVSRNPFINFLYNFRQQPDIQSKGQREIFKLAGERWRSMNDSERAPYINAAKEVRDKEPRINKPKATKKGGKSTKVTTNKNKKKIKKRTCSKCGHKHGSPSSYGESTDSFEKEPQDVQDEDEDEDDDKTSVASGSRSRSRSRSDSGSTNNNKESNYYSDSDTTF